MAARVSSRRRDTKPQGNSNGSEGAKTVDCRILSIRQRLDKECKDIKPVERKKAQCCFNHALAEFVYYRLHPEAFFDRIRVYRWVVLKVLTKPALEREPIFQKHLMAEGAKLILQLKCQGTRGGVKW